MIVKPVPECSDLSSDTPCILCFVLQATIEPELAHSTVLSYVLALVAIELVFLVLSGCQSAGKSL